MVKQNDKNDNYNGNVGGGEIKFYDIPNENEKVAGVHTAHCAQRASGICLMLHCISLVHISASKN